jgi:hypothetical protein
MGVRRSSSLELAHEHGNPVWRRTTGLSDGKVDQRMADAWEADARRKRVALGVTVFYFSKQREWRGVAQFDGSLTPSNITQLKLGLFCPASPGKPISNPISFWREFSSARAC